MDVNYFLIIGILIIVIGFALKLDSIAVVVISAIVTALIAKMPFIDILKLIGKSFVDARYMSLFFLTLPVIGISERYGLREQSAILIKKLHHVTTGRLLIFYQIIREIAGALSLRIGGHAQFVRPLVEPMAQGAAGSDNLSEDLKDEIKGASAASENFGNLFGQNLFFASSGTLLVLGTLTEQGYEITGQQIALWGIPVAITAVIIAGIRYLLLDKKIKNEINKNKVGKEG